MRAEIILDQGYLRGVRKPTIRHVLQEVGVIDRGLAIRHLDEIRFRCRATSSSTAKRRVLPVMAIACLVSSGFRLTVTGARVTSV